MSIAMERQLGELTARVRALEERLAKAGDSPYLTRLMAVEAKGWELERAIAQLRQAGSDAAPRPANTQPVRQKATRG